MCPKAHPSFSNWVFFYSDYNDQTYCNIIWRCEVCTAGKKTMSLRHRALLKVSEKYRMQQIHKKQLFIFHFHSIRLKPSALGAISFEEFLYDLL